MKIEVRTICCLSVTRRRHRRGMGCEAWSAREACAAEVAYDKEDEEVQNHVRDALADEELMECHARTLLCRVRQIPLVMEWATENSLSTQSNVVALAGPTIERRWTHRWRYRRPGPGQPPPKALSGIFGMGRCGSKRPDLAMSVAQRQTHCQVCNSH